MMETERTLSINEDQQLDDNLKHQIDALFHSDGQVEENERQPDELLGCHDKQDTERSTTEIVGNFVFNPSIWSDDGIVDNSNQLGDRSVISTKPPGYRVAREDWPDPAPLTDVAIPEKYPLDAFPDIVKAAIEEVVAFVKAPVPLVASSALGAVSLAVQSHVDVQRAAKLTGPVGLFLLTIAESGERKSTCDKLFTKAIINYQQEQHENAKASLQKHRADHASWSARKNGLIEKAKQAAKTGRPVTDIEKELLSHEQAEPRKPKVPMLIRGDETPESLPWSLAHGWPSAGIISSEAGIVFGGQGMKKDSMMGYLALLNVLWDGGEHVVGRKTTESYAVRDVRFTVALQVQEPTLRKFFANSEDLARGTGFLARFLIAWPESTQGSRMFTEPPSDWPNLTLFEKRITEILNMQVPLKENGYGLSPCMLHLSDDASVVWKAFHDAIEKELSVDGEFYDVRDVASKAPDNAARLASLFHLFDGNSPDAKISRVHLESACKVVLWYLKEARRFLGFVKLPENIKNAIMLNNWLIDKSNLTGNRKFVWREIQQFGPRPIRKKEQLGPAIDALVATDRIQRVSDGKSIELNPMIFDDFDSDSI